MPKFGLTMHEGTIQRFFKAPGERVNAGEPLYEVETEKVLYQVEAPASGTLAIALFDEGATVECGVAIAVIAEVSEDIATVAARYAKSASQPANHGSPVTSPPPDNRSAAPNASGRSRHPASPVARKLASELGVDLDKVEGTGPGGRITREDVERAAKSAPKMQPAIPGSQPPAAPSADRVAFRGMRKVIAERMHQSLHASAQITITAEADVTPATEFRARLSREFDFSYTDMMIHSVARALMRHPRMNARLGENATGAEIALCASANVGIAVALDEGLIVPVIQRAESKSVREIAVESRALGEKARSGQLKLKDVNGGTFTITNLGMFGIDAFTPILNPGETGILGVGRIVEKPAVYRGEIAKRAMLWLSLTFDHRVVDGAPAAQFLQSVIEIFNHGG